VQGAVPVGAPACRRDRETACQTSMPRPIAVSYPPHIMGKLACARDAKRCVLGHGAAIRYFDSTPIAFSWASSERMMTASSL
jgi:hypothetical protein